MSLIRRKAFISYHHADEAEVRLFIAAFDDAADGFIARGIGVGMAGDIIDSTDTDYIDEKPSQRRDEVVARPAKLDQIEASGFAVPTAPACGVGS